MVKTRSTSRRHAAPVADAIVPAHDAPDAPVSDVEQVSVKKMRLADDTEAHADDEVTFVEVIKPQPSAYFKSAVITEEERKFLDMKKRLAQYKAKMVSSEPVPEPEHVRHVRKLRSIMERLGEADWDKEAAAKATRAFANLWFHGH